MKQAVILCGGKGTRLGSLTEHTPKPMIKVLGKPFLDHLILKLVRYGFDDIVLCAGYLGDQIYGRYHGHEKYGVLLRVYVESTPQGTGGALLQLDDMLDDSFLVINGDTYYDINYVEIFRWVLDNDLAKRNIIVTRRVTGNDRYGIVNFDKSYCVTEFSEKHKEVGANFVNAGIYIFQRSYLQKYKGSTKPMTSLEYDILPSMASDGVLYAKALEENLYFVDIGLPRTLQYFTRSFHSILNRPALILDRDNTITNDNGYTYMVEDLEFINDAVNAIRQANSKNVYVFVVTNQSGIGRGYYSESDMRTFHKKINERLFEHGAHIDAFEFCPHLPDADCLCRKPGTLMLQNLLDSFHFDVKKSLMIGDKLTDFHCGNNFGIKSQVITEGSQLSDMVSNWVDKCL